MEHNMYSRTPVTRTLKGSEKQFELRGIRVNPPGNFQWSDFDQGKRNLVRVSGEFELSEVLLYDTLAA